MAGGVLSIPAGTLLSDQLHLRAQLPTNNSRITSQDMSNHCILTSGCVVSVGV